MIRPVRFILVLLAGLGLLAGCSGYDEDIEKVKAATTAGQVNARLVKDLAGARGAFQWTGRETEKYGAGSGIVLVEARVERTSRAGTDQVVQLQWLHNRATGVIDLEDILINGRSRGLLGAALDLLTLELE